MYCSTCGAEVLPSLTYCNRCGAELNAKQHKLSPTSMESLVWAIAAVTIVGMGAVIGLMAVMKEVLHFNDSLIIVFSLLFLATFIGIDSVFIWLLRSKFGTKKISGLTQKNGLHTKELEGPSVRILPEPPASVAEHTTRTLEKVERTRQTS